MAIIKCLNCGQDISDRAEKCVHCGQKITKRYCVHNVKKKLMKV